MSRVIETILKKRNGEALDDQELRDFVRGYTDGDIPDYQAAALLMAIFLQGMERRELLVWADAMLHSGRVLDLGEFDGPKVDKHSTGGVGDKISLILAPLVASADVYVPMISGRGLGHTGGTLDKLEAIPGFRTDLDLDRFRDMLRRHHCGLIGQTAEIAPADRKLYALRDATGTVESIPLIASSIMSKKLAEGLDGLVLDVKVGSGAFMKRQEDAAELARTMVTLGNDAGVRTTALLTDMDQPLGACIGNALEVRESIEVLRGGGPSDLRELTLELGAEMLLVAGTHTEREAALQTLTRLLDGGQAFERFRAIAADQGGDPRAIDDPDLLPSAERIVELKCDTSGWITGFDTESVGRAASLLGAGRARKEDPIDPAVGIVLHARRGDRVEAGDPLAALHVNDARELDEALRRCRAAIRIEAQEPKPTPLILDRIEAEG